MTAAASVFATAVRREAAAALRRPCTARGLPALCQHGDPLDSLLSSSLLTSGSEDSELCTFLEALPLAARFPFGCAVAAAAARRLPGAATADAPCS